MPHPEQRIRFPGPNCDGGFVVSAPRWRRLVFSGVAFLVFTCWLLVWLGVGPAEVLNTASQLSGVASLSVGVASLVATIVALVQAFRPQPRGPESIDEIAAELAGKIRKQWEDESGARRIDDPYALPVTWRPGPPDLFWSWERILEIAGEWPDERHFAQESWGRSPSDLVGRTLSRALLCVPTGRLVVLGEPGSGKTILLVQLTLEMLRARPVVQGPVPVLLSVTSWSPKTETLQSWLARTLETEHPWLARPAPGASSGQSCLSALLQNHLILPILDGLDEIPDKVRRSAVARINAWLQAGDRIVVSCRRDEYEALVTQTDTTVGVKLNGAAGVLLRSLTGRTVADYLVHDGGDNEESRRRWAPVTERLQTESTLTSALETPLMASLARTIYNPRENESTQRLPDPKYLTSKLGTVDEIRTHLFDGFVGAAYREHPDPSKHCPWSTKQAQRWLTHLARHLETLTEGPEAGADGTTRSGRTTDLAWWELHLAVHRVTLTLLGSAVPGVAVGVAALLGESLGIGLGVGLLLGILPPAVLTMRAQSRGPGRDGTTNETEADQEWYDSAVLGIGAAAASAVAAAAAAGWLAQAAGFGKGATRGLVGAVGVGLGAGPIGGIAGSILGGSIGGIGVGLTAGIAPGWPAGVLNGLGGGLAAGAILTLSGQNRPARGIRGVRWSKRAMAAGAVAGIGLGLTAGPIAGGIGALAGCCLGLLGRRADVAGSTTPALSLLQDRTTFLVFGAVSGLLVFAGATRAVTLAVGMAGGITVGLVFASLQAAWGRYTIARTWLALRRKVPWRIAGFLTDAHVNRGVLRQVGSVYQFRHAELQRHLAGRPIDR